MNYEYMEVFVPDLVKDAQDDVIVIVQGFLSNFLDFVLQGLDERIYLLMR